MREHGAVTIVCKVLSAGVVWYLVSVVRGSVRECKFPSHNHICLCLPVCPA